MSTQQAKFAYLFLAGSIAAFAQTSVTTYHYDNHRTGWNSTETILTPANVGGTGFGLLKKITLDDQVDAQPLVIPNVNITAGAHPGLHNVVYVATESNTVYAIDASSGGVLLKPNFGPPVSYPLGCGNNGPNVGINSTPVIDPVSSTLYVIVYTQNDLGPIYYLHALDLGSLTDKVTPQQITGAHTLTDGSTYTFNAAVQRQRPGLLLANGNIYAGFGSFCDLAVSQSRGWVLGWNSGTLQPLAANQLLDSEASSPDTFFLSAIWMSGAGIAADDAGDVVFITGNSDYSGTTYNGVTNLQESVVKSSADLSTVLDFFTPTDQALLDQFDGDFGAGGVLLLPDQPGGIPSLAVAAGKNGSMFLMNENDLGGYSTTGNDVLGKYMIGPCFCGESYFVDPNDGVARVVTSGGTALEVWKVQTSPTPTLTMVTAASILVGQQSPGFFTSVSSNGTANPIIWALSRPASGAKAPIYLYAFNPESGGAKMTQLFRGVAGNWQNLGGNSNLVPVVANGEVFVASNQQLQIFGLKP